MNGLIVGLLLPLLGTTLGSACVLLMRGSAVSPMPQKTLTGFAAGVMVAASVWSLLIPAIEMTEAAGFMKVFPAVSGFLAGMAFLLVLDCAVPHQHVDSPSSEGPRSRLSRTSKLVLAMTIHNIPEGMAVGVALAAAMEHNAYMSMAAAATLAVGIAIQNFPEGAIVAMPVRAAGHSRARSFAAGVLSGVVEPVGAVLTIVLATVVVPALPYLLAFSAGSMLYVVVEELIPETQTGSHSNWGTVGFAAGFALMMTLDVVLA